MCSVSSCPGPLKKKIREKGKQIKLKGMNRTITEMIDFLLRWGLSYLMKQTAKVDRHRHEHRLYNVF